MIPLSEAYLKRILGEFISHYNRGQPHSSLGPGTPEPPQDKVPASVHRHMLPTGRRVRSTQVLGGLHHEFRLEKEAA
jgi:putative transposase